MGFDFSGYATMNDLKCSDGRIIRADAFKHNDGATVPLVWQHVHSDPNNVLGHAVLENRKNGVYAYCHFNKTDTAKNAKELVQHGDIVALSIFANQLVQNGSDVTHGNIREVSLVLSGANPGALIDNVSLAHGDGTYDVVDDEAVIYTGLEISHAEDEGDVEGSNMPEEKNKERTIQDVLDEMTEEQLKVIDYLVSQASNGETDDTEEEKTANEMAQSAIGDNMARNVFENAADKEKKTLSHADFLNIVEDAKKLGSMKEAVLAHAGNYGIENIDVLFPDAKTVTPTPDFVSREMSWVPTVIDAARHTPFSRIKSTAADITADKARALGYIKGKKKKDEIVKLIKRVTTPTTIYKKQKLDRDDMIDITDLDVVAWLRSEMRMMLEEELARAILVGDGRDSESDDKINEESIRPIAKDDEFYTSRVTFDKDATPDQIENEYLRARKNYRGTGVPTLYATPDFVSDLLLQRNEMGERIYKTEAELAAALRVLKIVEVPVLAGSVYTKKDDQSKYDLLGIVVNLKDYTIGADRGGEVSMFDDFDIDYNQYKYLIETRASGALTHPKSAMVLERAQA